VNFTREPIIETIISPKEGCKLLVRSSKAGSETEEYYVDAVEVVSFGSAFFFRSMERPKAFLVPASDYEVLEVKEARVALKNVSHERSIKIGGGREAPMRHSHREPPQEREREAREPRGEPREPMIAAEEESQDGSEDNVLDEAINSRMEKRRDRRRRRHRRPSDEQEWSDRQQSQSQDEKSQSDSEQKAQGGGAEDEAKVSSQMFSSLIPPPPRLISETIGQYKDKEFMERPQVKEVVEAKEVSEERQETEKPPEEPTGSESTPLSRVISSTHFSSLSGGSDSYFL
jgi:hypothetical protein